MPLSNELTAIREVLLAGSEPNATLRTDTFCEQVSLARRAASLHRLGLVVVTSTTVEFEREEPTTIHSTIHYEVETTPAGQGLLELLDAAE